MIRTKDIPVVRGQTLPITFTIKDQRGQRVDLTGGAVYLWVRADMKVDASIKLASQTTTDHRIGIVISDQTGEHKGECVATLVPADTAGLVALGAGDPYIYDAWVVLADGSHFPIVSASSMPLYPQATTVP
jgi:hypothetical protein